MLNRFALSARSAVSSWHSPARAAVAIGIAAAAAILSFRGFYEPDLWWHLAQGRENLSGRLVRANVFSFTFPEYRQHFTSWLFDSTAYVAWIAGGGAAIQILQAGLLTATLVLVYRACRLRARTPTPVAAVAVLILGFFVIEPRAIPRPHLVSFACIAGCSLLVARGAARRSAAPLYWAVPAVAVWSNFHVEAIFGVLFLATFAACELVRPGDLPRHEAWRAAGAAAACGAATLATPYGWGLVRYVRENALVPQLLSIAELQPPYLPDYRAFFVYLAVAGALLVSRPRDLRLWEVLSAAIFAVLGLTYLRLTPLIFLVTAPMIAARLGAWIERGLDRRAILFTSLAVGILVSRIPIATLALELRAGTGAVKPAAYFSEDAVAFARAEGLEGPLFNSFNLGGYLAWTLFPRARTFQDSRLQAYPPEHFLTIINASASQADWDLIVSGVDWAVLSNPRPNQLSGAGRFPVADWATVFRDEAMEIVVRRRGRYGRLASFHERRFVGTR